MKRAKERPPEQDQGWDGAGRRRSGRSFKITFTIDAVDKRRLDEIKARFVSKRTAEGQSHIRTVRGAVPTKRLGRNDFAYEAFEKGLKALYEDRR
jgi:hypothetical protein